MFLPTDEIVWPPNPAVVRSGGRTLLVDSGLGEEHPDFARAGRWALRLEALLRGLFPTPRSLLAEITLSDPAQERSSDFLSAGFPLDAVATSSRNNTLLARELLAG